MTANATLIWRISAAMVIVAETMLIAAAVRIQRPTSSSDHVRAFHEIGLSFAARENWEFAVTVFSSALDMADDAAIGPVRKAELLTDLAVAHRQWAKRGNPQSLIIGLDAAEKAWRLHRAPMTAMNRALLLEALAGPEVASEAWAEYRKMGGQGVPVLQPGLPHRRTMHLRRDDNRIHARTSFPAAITESVVLAGCDRSSGSLRAAAEGILLLQSARKALAAQDVVLAETRLRQASSILRKLQVQFALVPKSDECTDTVARAGADAM